MKSGTALFVRLEHNKPPVLALISYDVKVVTEGFFYLKSVISKIGNSQILFFFFFS